MFAPPTEPKPQPMGMKPSPTTAPGAPGQSGPYGGINPGGMNPQRRAYGRGGRFGGRPSWGGYGGRGGYGGWGGYSGQGGGMSFHGGGMTDPNFDNPTTPLGGWQRDNMYRGGINPGGMSAGGPSTPGTTTLDRPMATGVGETAGVTGSAPPNPWAGVDPTSQWTGATARAELERRVGRPLTDAELADAQRYAGYNDPTGQAGMTGAQMNLLLQEAARRTPGATYQEYGGVDAEGHGGSGGTTPTGPTWTVEDAPEYGGPDYERADPYQGTPYEGYREFRAPTLEEMQADPGYQFRMQEANRALENSAAARGMLRGSNTLRDIVNYNQNAASQEYQNVYNRAADAYARNQDEYRYTHGMARDDARYGYETGRDENRYGYEQDSNNAQLRYAPSLMTWQARNAANQRQAELGWDRQFQREVYNRDDAWRRYTFGVDDEYRRWLESNQNRRFLVNQGNY